MTRNTAPAAMAASANDDARSDATTVSMGKVRMTVRREMRLRHVSDSPGPMGVTFGGDSMGHWNVSRIHRILDAMRAPVCFMPITRRTMRNMGRVGDPDMAVVRRYAALGRATMPPLTFIALPDLSQPHTVRTMLIDGHHRIMALSLMAANTVPARILPPELLDDVRIVEIGEAAVFPEPDFVLNEVVLRDSRHG